MYEFIQVAGPNPAPHLVISANGVGHAYCVTVGRAELHQQVLCPVELVVREDTTLMGSVTSKRSNLQYLV